MCKDQIEKSRAWLEPLAARVAGRRMAVVATIVEPAQPAAAESAESQEPSPAPSGPSEDLKQQAVSDPGMKTLLELLPLEIRGVERL